MKFMQLFIITKVKMRKKELKLCIKKAKEFGAITQERVV